MLIRAAEPERLVAAAHRGGFLIRNFGWDPHARNCLRITIGTEAQNDALLESLEGAE